MPAEGQPVTGPGSLGKGAAQSIKLDLTQKGLDFLGYKTLKSLLGSIGKSSFGAHETAQLSTGGHTPSSAWRHMSRVAGPSRSAAENVTSVRSPGAQSEGKKSGASFSTVTSSHSSLAAAPMGEPSS